MEFNETISINENQQNQEKKENQQNQQNDKTFNRLKELQDLLKKESALKELCKKIIKLKYYNNNV